MRFTSKWTGSGLYYYGIKQAVHSNPTPATFKLFGGGRKPLTQRQQPLKSNWWGWRVEYICGRCTAIPNILVFKKPWAQKMEVLSLYKGISKDAQTGRHQQPSLGEALFCFISVRIFLEVLKSSGKADCLYVLWGDWSRVFSWALLSNAILFCRLSTT